MMKKRAFSFINVKHTKLGKALHVFSWIMLMIWIFVGSALLTAEVSFKSILIWVLCAAAGVMQWVGLQTLISRYEEKRKPQPAQTSVQQTIQPSAQQPIQPAEPIPTLQPDTSDRFEVAGKQYASFNNLCKVEIPWDDKWTRLFSDIHGRLVLYTTERYPCFDWEDTISENRKYHLFYILTTNNQTRPCWACVRFPDEKADPEVLFQNLTHEELLLRASSQMEPLFVTMEQMAQKEESPAQ